MDPDPRSLEARTSTRALVSRLPLLGQRCPSLRWTSRDNKTGGNLDESLMITLKAISILF